MKNIYKADFNNGLSAQTSRIGRRRVFYDLTKSAYNYSYKNKYRKTSRPYVAIIWCLYLIIIGGIRNNYWRTIDVPIHIIVTNKNVSPTVIYIFLRVVLFLCMDTPTYCNTIMVYTYFIVNNIIMSDQQWNGREVGFGKCRIKCKKK